MVAWMESKACPAGVQVSIILGVNMGHVVRGQDVESATVTAITLIFDSCSAEERAGCADGDVQTKSPKCSERRKPGLILGWTAFVASLVEVS